jgi:hypothetical protein
MQITELATQYLNYMELKTRANGDKFYCLKDGAPANLGDLCYAAHGDFMPNHYIFEYIYQSLILISESESDSEIDLDELEHRIEPDIYHSDLLNWLSSNLNRIFYCDEELINYSECNSIMDIIASGQMREKRNIFSIVLKNLCLMQKSLNKKEEI